MRRWFLIILIALLPLRGWAGDVMAVQMLHRQAPQALSDAMYSIAAPAISKRADSTFDAKEQLVSAMPDCPGHAAQMALATPPAQTPPASDATPACEGCSTCQLCHLVGLAVLPDATTIGRAPVAQPVAQAVAYLSAVRANRFKPPIS